MPGSGPSGQSTPSPAHDSTLSLLLPSLSALAQATVNAGQPAPYTPYEMSAAETLAALPTSRPSTSHAAEQIHDDLAQSDDEGGITLLDVYDHDPTQDYGVDAALPDPTTYYPVEFGDQPLLPFVPPTAMSSLNTAQPYSPHTTLDHHVSALEALSMDQQQTPPATGFAPSLDASPVIDFLTNSGAVTHQHFQDYMAHAYEEHLNFQDNTAFMSPHLFYLKASSQKDLMMGLEEAEGDHLSVITRDDLAGEDRDYQGIIWSKRMPRAEFRSKRRNEEKARLSKVMRQYNKRHPPINQTENFFSFRRMDKRHRPWGPHFQLRNMMAVTSRQDIYYAERLKGIFKTDASGSKAQPIIDTTKHTVNGNMPMITTMAAMDQVLIAGGFEGEYAVVDLASNNGPHTSMDVIRDWAPETKSFITNHVHLFNDRSSYTPQAVLSSNDFSLRVLDCATNTFRYKFPFSAAVNCSATSADGRLRVVAGDFPETLITNAETGETLQTLRAHEGDAFACAWADDGIHVASAAQDGTIAVWDARCWRAPLAVLPCELSIPRVLRFSPLGSGPRVLVVAEADDYVSVINATTFANKQVFDFFGQTGGVDFAPDGQSLFVANSEFGLGGIIELERAGGWDAERVLGDVEERYWDGKVVDWAGEDEMDGNYRVLCGKGERNRRGLDLGSVDV
ncbi:WD domain-containing protein [Paraphaeosphaeria sporulosa]